MIKRNITTTMGAVFLAIGVAISAYAVFSLQEMRRINDNVDEVAERWLPSVSEAQRLENRLTNLEMAYKDHILADSKDDIAAAEQRLREETQKFEKELDGGAPSDMPELAQIRTLYAQYSARGGEVLTKSRQDDDADARMLLIANMDPVADQLTTLAHVIVERAQSGAQAAHDASDRTFLRITRISIAAIIATIVLTLSAGLYVLLCVARPIRTLTTSMGKLAGGDLETFIPGRQHRDEIGAMALAVDVFKQNAQTKHRLERQAEDQRLAAEAEREQISRVAEEEARQRMLAATASLADGLRRLAAGDLSFELPDPFAPDFEQLRLDLNAAIRQLGETLGQVSITVSSIDHGSKEIRRSADDLARRTEQQAASLEQTAAALDQITVNVTSSAEQVYDASQTTLKTNADARQSSEVICETSSAMARIEASSQQISTIISVIDDIAFQTNLLALNAGIEAARAGETGKGFAVVAQEVRELAQRSGSAAQEIKTLIDLSGQQVEAGAAMVRRTGETLERIAAGVQAANTNMNAIATAADSQATALREVNSAINQMDQVTQQNAAMVEETNAATATLAMEAERLKILVGRFSLPEANRRGEEPRASLRRVA